MHRALPGWWCFASVASKGQLLTLLHSNVYHLIHSLTVDIYEQYDARESNVTSHNASGWKVLMASMTVHTPGRQPTLTDWAW